MSRTTAWLPPITVGCIAATLLPYVGGGWVSDDFVHLIRLTDVESAHEVLTRPDGFGFYRPVPQLSLWLEGSTFGYVASLSRFFNGVLHVGIVILAFVVARKFMTPRAAAFAALAFALAPKAPTIAVLWISARPELFMSLFALVSSWAWLKWQEDLGRRGRWLGLCAVCYVLALLSKETALLLPLVLVFVVARNSKVTPSQRLFAALVIGTFAALPVILRIKAGALMPTSPHEQYAFDISPYRLWRSLEVYSTRALVSPLALVLASATVTAISLGLAELLRKLKSVDRGVALLSITWFIALIVPVAPIAARQELYLYLPGLGLCLLAGTFADAASDRAPRTGVAAAICLYAAAFLLYQQARHSDAHEVQQFTAALVESIRNDTRLRAPLAEVEFVAADAHSAEMMQRGVGGYINGVTAVAIPERTFHSSVVRDPVEGPAHKIRFRFSGGLVTLD